LPLRSLDEAEIEEFDDWLLWVFLFWCERFGALLVRLLDSSRDTDFVCELDIFVFETVFA